jgi:hypothetical protein
LRGAALPPESRSLACWAFELSRLRGSLGWNKTSSFSVEVPRFGMVMNRKWTEREFKAFKEWEKRFDRPVWWMLAVAICLPILGIVLSAMTK